MSDLKKLHTNLIDGTGCGALDRREGSVCGAQSKQLRSGQAFQGNSYDGRTLTTQLSQFELVTGTKPEEVFVSRGARGHEVLDSQVLISGQKRGEIAKLKRLLKQKRAIEPGFGHIKN